GRQGTARAGSDSCAQPARPMKAILVPVKPFYRAKQRLAGVLSEAARARLAQALCEDFFALLTRVKNAERIFVVSAEPCALHAGRSQGWEVIFETDPISESQSVDFASRHCAQIGVSALLRLPIDLPLALAEDVDDVLAKASPSPSVVIVPSHDGRGTNALL